MQTLFEVIAFIQMKQTLLHYLPARFFLFSKFLHPALTVLRQDEAC